MPKNQPSARDGEGNKVADPKDAKSFKGDPGQYSVEEYVIDSNIYRTTTDAGVAKQKRNDIAYGLMSQIEIVYAKRYQGLFGGKNAVALSGDFLNLGLSSAGTIATNVATKTILAALGTGVAGLALSVDKNFYAQQSFQIIGIAMQTRRDKIRAIILNNLKEDTTEYPLNAARRDLIQYLQAGTLASGLQELQEEAGAASAKTQEKTAEKPPEGVSKLSIYPGLEQNALVWTPSAGAKSYNVYYSTSAGVSKADKRLGPVITPYTIHSTSDTDSYYYAVTAVNDAGESALSAVKQGTPLPIPSVAAVGTIAAPSDLTQTTLGSSVLLTWSATAGSASFSLYKAGASPVPIDAEHQFKTGLTTNLFLDDSKDAIKMVYAVTAVGITDGAAAIISAPAQSIMAPVNISSPTAVTPATPTGVLSTPH